MRIHNFRVSFAVFNSRNPIRNLISVIGMMDYVGLKVKVLTFRTIGVQAKLKKMMIHA